MKWRVVKMRVVKENISAQQTRWLCGVYGEGLGDGYGYHGKEDEENDDDVFIRKQAAWVLDFWNASAALAGMESDQSWTISFHGWRVPRPNLNGYRVEEDEENDDDVVYSKVSNVGSGFSGMLQQRWSEWIVTGV
ncbi:hypothetical protein AAG906_035607 [Vitis piasezkii]